MRYPRQVKRKFYQPPLEAHKSLLRNMIFGKIFFLNKKAKIFGAKFGSDQGSYIIKIIQILKLKKHFKN